MFLKPSWWSCAESWDTFPGPQSVWAAALNFESPCGFTLPPGGLLWEAGEGIPQRSQRRRRSRQLPAWAPWGSWQAGNPPAARQLSLKSDSVLAIWSPRAGVFGWAVEVISRVTAMSNELSCRLKRVEAGGRVEVRELGCSLKGWESLVHLPADSGRLKGFSDSKKIFKF